MINSSLRYRIAKIEFEFRIEKIGDDNSKFEDLPEYYQNALLELADLIIAEVKRYEKDQKILAKALKSLEEGSDVDPITGIPYGEFS